MICVLVLFIGIRFWLSSGHLPNDNNWQFFLFLRPYYRYDELLFGVAVAYAVSQNIDVFRKSSLYVGLSIITLVFAYVWFLPGADASPSMSLLTREGVIFPAVLALGFSLIVYSLYDKGISNIFVNVVARLAYPLYLIHMFVITKYSALFGYLALSLIAALMCSYAVEYPFIRMYKAKRESSESEVVAVTA